MPHDLRGRYQYFTQADMHKLRLAGWASPSHTLEAGVRDYVRQHLLQEVLAP
jgi:ADP-L-glycero-D-manno-heptose 6-epimerase